MVEAPAAVTVVSRSVQEAISVAGQAPLAFGQVPGVDIAQSGVNDFNVNARGFNFSLVRSMMVLQDGRDLSIPLLGSQEWAAMSMPLEDVSRIEVIRGPGSALYGANAFSGVIDIRTPAAREIVGTKVSLAGGEQHSWRFDLRHAGVTSNARFGYRVNLGYSRVADWSKSRTRLDGADFKSEYAGATDSTVHPPAPGFERFPLKGQTRDPITGAALGQPDDLITMYGSGRLDYYMAGGMATVDGGAAQAQNGVFLTSIGRVQVPSALRPWARVSWENRSFNLSGWYSGRSLSEPQVSLNSGQFIDDASAVFHGAGRYSHSFQGSRSRIVFGASVQDSRVNTDGTLIEPSQDDRGDKSYAIYSEVQYSLTNTLKLVGALRWDKGDLFAGRTSPKAAVVFTPVPNHGFRLSFNRAFLTPSLTQFFLKTVAGVQNLTALENGLRSSPLGPVLAGVPSGQLFSNSAAVPVMAFGNRDLVPETVVSYELGYKGQLAGRLFITADGYFSQINNFVTSLLPATVLNPAFKPWAAPAAVPDQYKPQVEGAVRSALAGTTAEFGLTRLSDGTTAIVVSNGNAGEVNEWGVELGTTFSVGQGFSVSGAYSFFDFEIKKVQAGDVLLPNTPRHKGGVTLGYSNRGGLDVSVETRFVESYAWSVGVYRGYVPSNETVNTSLSYRLTSHVRVQGTATNVLNQQRYQMYGGSVVGRRVLAGVTATF
jgi:iron complex outermembrane receptor protein